MSAPLPAPSGASPPPTPPSTSINVQASFQPAKYFTLIFFGLSLVICGLMAVYITLQVCRRRRLQGQRDEERASRIMERRNEQDGPPPRDIPLKEGFIVSHPNGEVEVAYEDMPKAEDKEAATANALPSTAAPRGSGLPQSQTDADGRISRHGSQELGRVSSLQEPLSEASQRRLRVDAEEEEERRRRSALYIWSL